MRNNWKGETHNTAQNKGMAMSRGKWEGSQHGEKLTAEGRDGISKGVLVAISIPVFTAQLHAAKDATDISNARALYAELQADYLLEGNTRALSV